MASRTRDVLNADSLPAASTLQLWNDRVAPEVRAEIALDRTVLRRAKLVRKADMFELSLEGFD